VPFDFHFFPKMKKFWVSKQMATDGEEKEAVVDWLNILVSNLCDKVINKIV
jgi:hypothetical protein